MGKGLKRYGIYGEWGYGGKERKGKGSKASGEEEISRAIKCTSEIK